jgi:hypothetical protein
MSLINLVWLQDLVANLVHEARRQRCTRLWMSEISDEWKEGDIGLALTSPSGDRLILFRHVEWLE